MLPVSKLVFAIMGMCVAMLALLAFAPFTIAATVIGYGCILYFLFFEKSSATVPFAVGYTIGLELLGTTRFGVVSLLTVTLFALYLLFGEYVKAISPFSRYTAALVVFSALYATITAGRGALHALPSLVVAIAVVIIGCHLLTRHPRTTIHELA